MPSLCVCPSLALLLSLSSPSVCVFSPSVCDLSFSLSVSLLILCLSPPDRLSLFLIYFSSISPSFWLYLICRFVWSVSVFLSTYVCVISPPLSVCLSLCLSDFPFCLCHWALSLSLSVCLSLSRCLISLCLFLSVSLRFSSSHLSLHFTSVDPMLCNTRGFFPQFKKQQLSALNLSISTAARNEPARVRHGQTALSVRHVSPLCPKSRSAHTMSVRLAFLRRNSQCTMSVCLRLSQKPQFTMHFITDVAQHNVCAFAFKHRSRKAQFLQVCILFQMW